MSFCKSFTLILQTEKGILSVSWANYHVKGRCIPLLGDRTKRRLSFLINFTFWALWLLLLLGAGRLIVRILLPFAAAYILAYALQRPTRWLETRFRFTHGFAATAVCLLTLTLIGGVLCVGCYQGGALLWRLIKQEQVLDALQSCFGQLRHTVETLLTRLSDVLPADLTESVLPALTSLEQTLLQSGGTALASLSGNILAFLTNALPRFLLAALFFVLSLLFFTRDYTQVCGFLFRQIPLPQRPLATAAVRALRQTTVCTVRAYVLLGLVTFFETSIGFLLLRLPAPLLWALFTALVDALPVFGVGAVLWPLSLYKFLLGDIGGAIGTLVLYGVCTVTHHLLQPRLVSKQTGLPPLLTLLSMYIGWRTAGLLGLLSFPILTMVILQLQKENHLRIFR